MVAGQSGAGSRSGARRRKASPPPLPANVVLLRQRILPRHSEHLARWLEAGRRMGLCDASAFSPERATSVMDGPRQDYVLVWVRENIDPAYMVIAEGVHWVVVDAIRQVSLANFRTFEAALDFIRPVLPLDVAA